MKHDNCTHSHHHEVCEKCEELYISIPDIEERGRMYNPYFDKEELKARQGTNGLTFRYIFQKLLQSKGALLFTGLIVLLLGISIINFL